MIHSNVYLRVELLDQLGQSADLGYLPRLLELVRQASAIDLMEGYGEKVVDAIGTIVATHIAEIEHESLRQLVQLPDLTTYGWMGSGDEERIDYSRPLDIHVEPIREMARLELQRRGQSM